MLHVAVGSYATSIQLSVLTVDPAAPSPLFAHSPLVSTENIRLSGLSVQDHTGIPVRGRCDKRTDKTPTVKLTKGLYKRVYLTSPVHNDTCQVYPRLAIFKCITS